MACWFDSSFMSQLAPSTRRNSKKEQRNSHQISHLPPTSPPTPSGNQYKEKLFQKVPSCIYKKTLFVGNMWHSAKVGWKCQTLETEKALLFFKLGNSTSWPWRFLIIMLLIYFHINNRGWHWPVFCRVEKSAYLKNVLILLLSVQFSWSSCNQTCWRQPVIKILIIQIQN